MLRARAALQVAAFAGLLIPNEVDALVNGLVPRPLSGVRTLRRLQPLHLSSIVSTSLVTDPCWRAEG